MSEIISQMIGNQCNIYWFATRKQRTKDWKRCCRKEYLPDSRHFWSPKRHKTSRECDLLSIVFWLNWNLFLHLSDETGFANSLFLDWGLPAAAQIGVMALSRKFDTAEDAEEPFIHFKMWNIDFVHKQLFAKQLMYLICGMSFQMVFSHSKNLCFFQIFCENLKILASHRKRYVSFSSCWMAVIRLFVWPCLHQDKGRLVFLPVLLFLQKARRFFNDTFPIILTKTHFSRWLFGVNKPLWEPNQPTTEPGNPYWI